MSENILSKWSSWLVFFAFMMYAPLNAQFTGLTDLQAETLKASTSSVQVLQPAFDVQYGADGTQTTCANAIPITSGNFTDMELVCGTSDDLNESTVGGMCEDNGPMGGQIPSYYGDGMEALYSYTPGESGTVNITVHTTSWAALMVYEGCPTAGNCVTATRAVGDSRSVTFEANAGTEYYIWVDSWPEPSSPCVEGGMMDFSGPGPTGGGSGSYCEPLGDVSFGDYIDSFSVSGAIENFTNVSGDNGGYGDFYDDYNVTQAQDESVNFTAHFDNGTMTYGFRIWVDWNQDGVFDPVTEVAWASTAYATSHSGSFTVPEDALPGETRMRIINNWSDSTADVDPCDDTATIWGEFEDYKFTVEEDDGGGTTEGDCDEVFTDSAADPNNFFNSYAGVTFDVVNETAEEMTITGFKVPVSGSSTLDLNVWVTTTAASNVGVQTDPSAWTLVESITGVPANIATDWDYDSFTQVDLSEELIIPGNDSRGVYLLATSYASGTDYHYTNGNFTATDGNLTVLSNGFGSTADPFANNFEDRAFVGEVQYCAGETTIPPGGEDCSQGIPSVDDFPMSWRITIGQDFRLAEDFTVPEGTVFSVNQLTFDTNQVEVPDYAIINIREDNGEEPGAILHTIEMEPTSWEEIGTTWDEPLYKITFDLEESIEFGEGMYWIDPQMSVPSGSDVWWGGTDLYEDGLRPRSSSNDGETWVSYIALHLVFTISGHCETLSTAEPAGFDFSYYPNPVRDRLYINSVKKVENVRVFDLTGREIISHSKTGNGQIDVNALPTGVYIFRVMLEGGQVETFKIIKR